MMFPGPKREHKLKWAEANHRVGADLGSKQISPRKIGGRCGKRLHCPILVFGRMAANEPERRNWGLLPDPVLRKNSEFLIGDLWERRGE